MWGREPFGNIWLDPGYGRAMTFRFCLYGFLKNQRYYEPFLILYFLERGLSFFWVGLLVAFRELWVNLLEVPSGAAADLYGRRRTMIVAWLTYLTAFLILARLESLPWLFVAMAGLACGDSFRSGTHKAMIFDWLASQGRQDEKARFYGLTRSWSQIGAAVSVLIAAAIVLWTDAYQPVFLYTMVPYGLGLVNFLGYPKSLDGVEQREVSWRLVGRHLRQAFAACWRVPPLRRLLSESMLQRGTYSTVKDYLQPLLEHTALALPLLLGLDDKGRTALLVALVYCLLYLGSAVASRQAHVVEGWGGGPGPTGRKIWLVTLVVYGGLSLTLGGSWPGVAIGGFVVLALLQNLWKPLFIARVDEASERHMGATLLSIDSQTKALFVMVAAPLLGLAVDQMGLVAVAWFGLAIAGLGWWLARVRAGAS